MYASQQRVRAYNLEAVAELTRRRGSCSRGEIGETLGLNKATVSSLVTELVGRGLLEDAGRHAGGGPGRPRQIVRTDTRQHVSLVAEILTDRIRLSSWTLAATRIDHRTIDVDPVSDGPTETLRRTATAVARLVRRLRTDGRTVTGLAVSVPGLVDARTGLLVSSTPLGWQHVDLRNPFRSRSALQGLPVIVERVANLATITEWRSASDRTDLVCLHGGETGLGVGVVTGGRLLTGAHGRAGGLLFADNPAPRGNAGRTASTKPTRDVAVELLGLVRDRDSGFADETDTLLDRLRSGDRRVQTAVARFGRTVGPRLVALAELFDPQDVIFAGPLAPLAEHLVPQVRAALRGSSVPDVSLVAGSTGAEASLIGGALMLADLTFSAIDPAA